MTPIPFPEANTVYVLPGCGDLPALVTEDGRTVTVWEMTDEQAYEIISGSRKIVLNVVGHQPPVSLGVLSHLDGETPIWQ